MMVTFIEADEPREKENQTGAAPSVGREQIALKVLNDNDWHGAWGTVEETVALLREAGVFDESSVPSCWCGKNRDEVAAPSVGELEWQPCAGSGCVGGLVTYYDPEIAMERSVICLECGGSGRSE